MKYLEVRPKEPENANSDYELTGETVLGNEGFFREVFPGIVEIEGVLKYAERIYWGSGWLFINPAELTDG